MADFNRKHCYGKLDTASLSVSPSGVLVLSAILIFVTEPAGMRLYRARRQPAGKTYATAGSLGPPPRDVAIQTNRMSPPGIVMTDVSEDIDTALAETADKAPSQSASSKRSVTF